MHIEPLAMLFYDVITDAEIDVVIELAGEQLRQALVVGRENGTDVNVANTESRVAKKSVYPAVTAALMRYACSCWLKADAHPVIATWDRRAELMTNLHMSTAEAVQVGNYGVGGHYRPHWDTPMTVEYLQSYV